MKRPGREQPTLGRTDDGGVVFCDPGSRDVELIAALRDALDRVDPVSARAVTDAKRIGGLADQVRIPPRSAFVEEILGENTRNRLPRRQPVNDTEPVAVFRTAAHDAFVSLHSGDDGTFTAVCTGCGLHLGPEACAQKPAEQFANAHAALCTRLPREQWPAGFAATEARK